jgi:hypothetical protein
MEIMEVALKRCSRVIRCAVRWIREHRDKLEVRGTAHCGLACGLADARMRAATLGLAGAGERARGAHEAAAGARARHGPGALGKRAPRVRDANAAPRPLPARGQDLNVSDCVLREAMLDKGIDARRTTQYLRKHKDDYLEHYQKLERELAHKCGVRDEGAPAAACVPSLSGNERRSRPRAAARAAGS